MPLRAESRKLSPKLTVWVEGRPSAAATSAAQPRRECNRGNEKGKKKNARQRRQRSVGVIVRTECEPKGWVRVKRCRRFFVRSGLPVEEPAADFSSGFFSTKSAKEWEWASPFARFKSSLSHGGRVGRRKRPGWVAACLHFSLPIIRGKPGGTNRIVAVGGRGHEKWVETGVIFRSGWTIRSVRNKPRESVGNRGTTPSRSFASAAELPGNAALPPRRPKRVLSLDVQTAGTRRL